MAVRSPFTALFLSLLAALALAPLFASPVLLLRWLDLPSEVALFYPLVAFAIAGFLAGRSGTFPFAAFAAGFLGAFIGYALFALVSPPFDFLYAVLHAVVAAAAAWAAATWWMAEVTPEIALENVQKRRCRMCGARVGPRARKCWSCRASLYRIT